MLIGERNRPYMDRVEAGEVLAEALAGWFDAHGDEGDAETTDTIVLGLPRGGVPVAGIVARELGAPLDVLVVRKLGVPRQREVAMGALASAGDVVVRVDNPDIVAYVRSRDIGDAEIEQIEAIEMAELRRRQASYRQGVPDLDLAGRAVIIVDDGLATGATVLAAVGAARRAGARRVVVALPVIVGQVPRALEEAADAVVCPWVAPDLPAVGAAYERFDQTSDDEVREVLRGAR